LRPERMNPLWTKRVEIPWLRVINLVGIILSLPSWGFLVSVVVRRHWVDDYAPQSVAIAIGCCICSSIGALLLSGGTARERARAPRVWLAVAPAAIIVIVGCFWVFYRLCYDFGHLHVGDMR
jgi:hypothetical protein